MEEQKQQECTAQTQELLELGASTTKSSRGNIYTLTIIGQIEGHQVLPETVKTTKYEHVIPLLAAVEESEEIDGLLLLLNTVGGDIEAGLAIAELIAGMKKPTVSLVLGGGHSIGIPLAVSAKRAIIAPRASMTVHPVRMTGLVVGAPQTYHYFDQIQDHIVDFVTENSRISRADFARYMMATGNMATETIPATGGGGHTHSYGSEWKSDADKHWHECSCGDKKDTAAHTASDWITDTAATATTDGTKHKECTVCKRVLETGTIPATGSGEHTHNYSSDWKSDSINHWKECSCGDKADVAAHSFKWVVDKEATATKKGSKHEECKVCGYQRPAVEIPATGTTTKPTDPTQTNPSTGAESPKTGDNSNMMLWFAVLFVSGFGVLGTVIYGKKKKEQAE